MSMVLFFGFSAVVIVVGLVFSGLVIRHHWQKSRLHQKMSRQNTLPNQEN